MRASVKTPNLSGLSGTVHMGRARRQMLDTEFENVVKSSSAQVASHPFTKGEYNNFQHNYNVTLIYDSHIHRGVCTNKDERRGDVVQLREQAFIPKLR